MDKINQVLLIDDDQISNFLTAAVLKRNLYPQHISTCSNGQEALYFLNQQVEATGQLPDLILLDINMPNTNGFDFLKGFRAFQTLEKQPVIIILTNYSSHQDFEKLIEYPEVEVCLNKPLAEEDLQYIVAKYQHEQQPYSKTSLR